MTNIYIISKDIADDDAIVTECIPNMLTDKYGVTDEKRIITGDIIDDTNFLAERLETDTNAWFVFNTKEKVYTFLQHKNKELIQILLSHPNQKVSDVLLAEMEKEE